MNGNAQYWPRFQGMGRRKEGKAHTSWWARACAALVLSAATAIALPAQTFTTLHSFDGTDGAYPTADLVQATDGNFYGTPFDGGAYGDGTVFKITPSGRLTTLHTFCPPADCTDGANPGGLVQDTNGTFYGTTLCGGAYDPNCVYWYGTVFSLSVGLGPFVETEPTSGPVGTPVRILGTNLKYVLTVTFNGTMAKFTVVSPTEITTTVPPGATTGEVKVLELVVVDGHFETLSSNVPFRVP